MRCAGNGARAIDLVPEPRTPATAEPAHRGTCPHCRTPGHRRDQRRRPAVRHDPGRRGRGRRCHDHGDGETPPELAALDIRGKFYELGPDGTQFDVPVTITRFVDPATAGFDLSLGIPAIVLASRSADGSWEWLDDQAVEFDGSRLVVTATTTHFSTVTAFGGAVHVLLQPPTVALDVGATFMAGFGVFAGKGVQVDVEAAATALATGTVGYVSSYGLLKDFPDLVNVSSREIDTFSCAQPGEGTYGFKVGIEEVLGGVLKHLFVDAVSSSVTVTGEGPLPRQGRYRSDRRHRRRLLRHAPAVRGHPSNVSGTMVLFGPEGTLGGTLVARILGANGDQPFEVPISAQGDGVFQVGIDAYGPKVFDSFTYETPGGATVDVTAQVQDILGASAEVGPGEGVLAGEGTCPY